MKRDEDRTSRWDETPREDRESREHIARSTEGHRRYQENHQAKEQVLDDEQVARIIAEAEEREEQLRQEHSAQITENDEKMARSLFWEQQNAINKEFIKRQEHATRIFQEDQDRTRAKEEEKRKRQECAGQRGPKLPE